ncbi:MAG TPA: hypothetical protein VEA81_11895 [Burkholderiaceae bacterium]|nr:hypothetical protein [Burkholderiaceae bacterium]
MTGSAAPPRPGLRTALAVAAAVLAVTLALRHFAVEPEAIAHACDPAPWTGACALRTALITTFVNQEVGWLALAAGALATVLRGPRLALLALACGAAGLVLYSYEPAGVGALLGLLVLARAQAAPASTSTIDA